MGIVYENHGTDGSIYVSDENGEHNFLTEEEYEAYKSEKFEKLPTICDTCIYHLQKDKEKFKCQLGHEGECKGCSYYWKNPENWEDWFKYYKNGFLSRYYYYRDQFNRKFKLGFYRSCRKFFFYWPSFKYPYFMFVKRVRNEYEDECNVYCIGFVSKENSYYNKATFFEKFYYPHYHFYSEHINYEYALCTNDYYVTTFNNIKTNDCMFKCHAGKTYRVRPVSKYKYYDILRPTNEEDEYEINMKGQIPENEFNKYFRLLKSGEYCEMLEKKIN